MTHLIECLNCEQLDRRSFCRNMMLAAAVFGVGGSSMLSGAIRQDEQEKKHKFSNPSNLTFEQVFLIAYANTYIPHMQYLADNIGREKFLGLLKKAASESVANNLKAAADRFPKRDLATFASLFKNNPGVKDTLTFTIVEDTDKAFEIKVTECLWAKTFLQAKAADIGYAGICFADYATATAFNPDIRMIRDKTLMEGQNCCNHRYVFKG